MICYKKINLECGTALKTFVLDRITQFLSGTEVTRVMSEIISLPEEMISTINVELKIYNVPAIEYCRVYLRPKNDIQFSHIDGGGEVLHCAINIPLHGGENSKFQWLGGDYSVSLVNLPTTNQKAFAIKWNSEPTVIESIEMIDGCYLVRIDQPHQAIASADSDRWVFTMRFKGNPTFEELYDKLSASNI